MSEEERAGVHILVVEDELKVAAAIKAGLAHEGYDARVVPTGEEALRSLAEHPPGFVILDLGLPDCDGIDVLHSIREHQSQTPVLILSARDSSEARVRGLDEGADDYLIKPFEFAELLARVRSVLRRAGPHDRVRFKIGDLELNVVQRKVTRAGVEVEVTNREFQILECLFRNLGQPVSRNVLAENVWKGMARVTPIDNVIDVHMARLRRKVDAGRGVALIRTIRGVGFVLGEGDE